MDINSENQIGDIIIRYLEDRSTDFEKEELLKWIQESEENERYFKHLVLS